METASAATRKRVFLSLLALHLAGYVWCGVTGWIAPFDLFNLILFAFNISAAVMLIRSRFDLWVGAGVMILITAHTFAGHQLAPDELTSGAILLTSILVLYVGMQINKYLPLKYWWVFVASFFALYAIFIHGLPNAEPLFILFLMGMVACARSLRLMAYFWALTLSFTVGQPYSWEAVFILFFILTALFSARSFARSKTTAIFLGVGMAVVFLVLLPIISAVFNMDLHNVGNVLSDLRVREAIWRTFYTATISTFVLIVFMIPFAYALSRLRFRGRTLILSLIDLPIVIPQSVAGMVLLQIFGRKQVLGGAIEQYLGIPVDGTVLGICLAQIFVALPFLTKSAVTAFDSVDEQLEVSARILGASSWSVFWRIACPLAGRGIFLGAVLAWARAAGEFGAVLIVAPSPETAPITAYNRFNSVGVYEAAPLVVVLLLFSVAMFFILQLVGHMIHQKAG